MEEKGGEKRTDKPVSDTISSPICLGCVLLWNKWEHRYQEKALRNLRAKIIIYLFFLDDAWKPAGACMCL